MVKEDKKYAVVEISHTGEHKLFSSFDSLEDAKEEVSALNKNFFGDSSFVVSEQIQTKDRSIGNG